MVQAILDGRKTQTRRLCKPQPRSDIQDTFDPIACGLLLDVVRTAKYDIGDILWVRETWWHNREVWGDSEVFLYKADFPIGGYDHVDAYKWKPSIFMPKDACRIKLRVTDIRIERLLSITEKDAEAEGVDCSSVDGGQTLLFKPAFFDLWDKINGKGSWEKNPWAWVITFERITNL